jgi:hypothetical protein
VVVCGGEFVREPRTKVKANVLRAKTFMNRESIAVCFHYCWPNIWGDDAAADRLIHQTGHNNVTPRNLMLGEAFIAISFYISVMLLSKGALANILQSDNSEAAGIYIVFCL